MSATTLAPPTAVRSPAGRSAARSFLLRAAGTLLPMVAALVGLQLAVPLVRDAAGSSGGGWPVSVAVAGGWALAATAWLRRRGWSAGTLTGTGAGLAAALAPTAAVGWLSPSGLLLWGPVSTLLAAALALAARPLPSAVDRSGKQACSDAAPPRPTEES